MVKRLLVLMMILALMMSGSLIACGGGDEDEGGAATTPAKTTPAKTTPTKSPAGEGLTPQPTSGGGEGEGVGEGEETQPTATKETSTGGDDLGKLLAKMPKCVQTTLVTIIPGEPEMQQKLWMKEKKYRTEMEVEGHEAISLGDLEAGILYYYVSDTDSWMRMTLDPADIQSMDKESILDCDPKVIGSDTYDGKACTIVQYNCGDFDVKTWIWKDKGWPLKEEMVLPTGEVSTIVYKDLSFDCAADSLFELPAGAKVTDFDEMMEGIGGGMPEEGFQLPEGFELPEGIEMPEGFPMPQ